MTLTFWLGNLFALHLLAFCWDFVGIMLASKVISFAARIRFFYKKKVCVFRMLFVVNIHLNVDVVVFFCLIVDVDVDFNQFCFWMMI